MPNSVSLVRAEKTYPGELKRFSIRRRMKNRYDITKLFHIALIVSALFLASSCSKQTDVQEVAQDKAAATQMVAQADNLYAQRANLARAREGVILLRRSLASDTGSYDAAWRLARFNYFLGSHTTDKTERDRAFNEGVEAGRRAIKLQDGKPEGHFWLGANLGGKAQSSALSGMAAVDEIRSEMEKVIKLDEGFQSGSAYMALGQVYLEAPGMLGGDSKKAVEVLEKGLRFGENNELYHVRLAQAYLAVERKEDARRELNKVLNMTPDPDYLPEANDAAAEAHKMLDEMK
jgi:Tfp pilus assembly protein PilF